MLACAESFVSLIISFPSIMPCLCMCTPRPKVPSVRQGTASPLSTGRPQSTKSSRDRDRSHTRCSFPSLYQGTSNKIIDTATGARQLFLRLLFAPFAVSRVINDSLQISFIGHFVDCHSCLHHGPNSTSIYQFKRPRLQFSSLILNVSHDRFART